MDGALLSQPLVFLVLQLFGHADVVLHELVLLNVGGVVVLDYGWGRGATRKKALRVRRCILCEVYSTAVKINVAF